MTLRLLAQTILAGLIAIHIAFGAGTEEQFYSIQLENATISRSTGPVPFEPGQTILATIWNQSEQTVPVALTAIDAMTGEALGAADKPIAPGVVSVMVLPVAKPSMRYVMFQADGKPLRAKVQVSFRIFDGPLTGESLNASWGRMFDLEATSKLISARTEPLVLTDAHHLTVQLFNQGGRAAVTVRGWDVKAKKEFIGETRFVEGSRGARIEISSAVAKQLAPIVVGGTANGMMQFEVIVEPLDGAADISFTIEAQSEFGEVTLKKGYIASPDFD